jgi:hypothetical protein
LGDVKISLLLLISTSAFTFLFSLSAVSIKKFRWASATGV